MKSKAEANDGLLDFINNYGIPEWLIVDGAMEQGGGRNTAWRGSLKTYHIKQTFTEPYSPWQNRAEGEIREMKRDIKKMMRHANSPKRLWNYLRDLIAKKRRVTASSIPSMQGRTPHEQVLGWTPDISTLIQYEWYQWVYYRDHDGEQKLGRWLTPADTHGGGDTYWILPISCRPIVRSTVWAVPAEDLMDPEKTRERDEFGAIVRTKLGTSSGKQAECDEHLPNIDYGDLFDEADLPDVPFEEEATMPEADDYTADTYDELLMAQVLLPRNGEQFGTVRRRAKDGDGNPIGKRANNPILDTHEYEVEFPDRSTDTYSTNLIAENLYSQIDDEGRQYQLLSEITGHRSNGSAVAMADGMYVDKNGSKKPKTTTRGWELLIA
jgi:hypothetical protein